MSVQSPIRYGIRGLPARTYLAFRTERVGDRELLSLIPDSEEQHPLDVVACFTDEAKLYVADAVTGDEIS